MAIEHDLVFLDTNVVLDHLADREDFEDAVQLESAAAMQRGGVLVSRNARDFTGGRMQVLSPEEYLASRIERGL